MTTGKPSQNPAGQINRIVTRKSGPAGDAAIWEER